MHSYKILYALFGCLITFNCWSQEVINVKAMQEGRQVVIMYDIEGGNGKVEIKLYYGLENGAWQEIVSGVSGDIGKVLIAGKGKIIKWNPLQESNKLKGDGYRFKVSVVVKEEDTYGIDRNMIFVEGGSFEMGCIPGKKIKCDDDERPSHPVSVSSFYISKYEVTQAQWNAVMGDSEFSNCNNCAVAVSWSETQLFIEKLNNQVGRAYRLPTEAEWEFAARGGKQSKNYLYSGSNDIEEVAWYAENVFGLIIQAIARKKPNELGLYDMTGNAWEWCHDWYQQNYYSQSTMKNPSGPSIGDRRVIRGGSIESKSEKAEVFNRAAGFPDVYNALIKGYKQAKVSAGFRLAE